VNVDPFDEVVRLVDAAGQSSDLGLVSQAAEAVERFASRLPAGSSAWTHTQIELGRCFGLAFHISNDRSVLDETIAVLRRAANAAAATDEWLPNVWHNLGNALVVRYQFLGDTAALTEAETAYEAALNAPVLEEPHRPLVVVGLLEVALQLAANGRETALTRAVIKAAHEEVRRMPSTHVAYPLAASGLARLLIKVYESDSDDAALAAAGAVLDSALDAGWEGPGRALILAVLVRVHQYRWADTGDPRLLEDAIGAGNEAVLLTPSDDYALVSCLHGLATVYVDQFWHSGDVSSLDTAEEHFRAALAMVDENDLDYATILTGLAEALMVRHHLFGDEGALDESIALRRLAVARAIPADMRTVAQTNLAAGLVAKYRIQRDVSLLDEAERVQRIAVQTISAGDRQRWVAHSTIGNIYFERYLGTHDVVWLDKAEPWLRQAADAAPTDPASAECLADFGQLLRERFQLSGERAVGHGAVDAIRRAVQLTPPDSRSRDTRLVNLAGALSETGSTGEALSVLRDVAYLPIAAPRTAASAARRAGRLAMHFDDAGQALELYRHAVSLLPKVVPWELSRADQEQGLGALAGLAGAAAAAAIEAGDVTEALVMVETARGVLLSREFDLRDRRHRLRTLAPELARRFEHAVQALNASHSRGFIQEPGPRMDALARHRALSTKFDAAVTEIRGIDGYHDFLGSPSIESIIRDAGPGSTVGLVHGDRGAYAIVVESGRHFSIALPGVTPDMIAAQAGAFLEAIEVATDPRATAAARIAAEEQVHAGLEWLWDRVTVPVLGRCGTRITWIPSGLFALLPIHAAGYHRASGHRTVLDRVVSSYGPTVAALGRSRRRSIAAAPAGTLVVGLSDAPGLTRLVHAGYEAEQVAALAPGAELLDGPAATREAILRRLPTVRHFHYAGHAESSWTGDGSGRLLAYDWQTAPLTAADVAGLSLTGADLAFLGGCDTALNAIKLADEAVTILAAFHLAGFRHVIGGLWALDDEAQAAVAEHVWAHVRRDGTADVAQALGEAIRAQRDQWRRYPSTWAGYVHVGP
jgi:tetratricopeptide (TPR) repeat protein